MLKSIFHAPAQLRTLLYPRHASTTPVSQHIPRIAQPSLWTSLIPKSLRRDPHAPPKPPGNSKWRAFTSNPATPILCLALLIGSQAINTLALKHEILAYTRQTEGKLALLREVIQRVQRGEDVDVEGILGTGKVTEEGEWFDVIKEIEEEERAWSRKKKRAEKLKMAEEEDLERQRTSENKEQTAESSVHAADKVERKRGPKFV